MTTDEMTEKIIGCAYEAANRLGHGFLEKVYENALAHEIRKSGLTLEQQYPIPVVYDGILVGDFTADFCVGNEVLVELKAVRSIEDIHIAQCLNYLKATSRSICLLINFGNPSVEVRRVINAR
jgi:GxxExxY protein